MMNSLVTQVVDTLQERGLLPEVPEAVARSVPAIPIVNVRHPQAQVTHEAAVGSVDDKQLETLMARGLSKDEAADVIIEGLLS